ncbi:putative beta-glucosidase [Lupinus albus]|uniref:Putative beta-glucosidase n=1 Tax=Lupinus albus TaxID=3870 RepID=A0A6A4QBB9_LUPAL|nr:putative beta-glucosidase [Lupinus albus]
MQDKQHGFIGFNLLTYGCFPLTNTTKDISAANRDQDFYVGWFLNPFTFGEYPDTMKKNFGSRLPLFSKSESNLVKGSIDFLEINYYMSFYVKDNLSILQIKDRDFMVDMGVEHQCMYMF